MPRWTDPHLRAERHGADIAAAWTLLLSAMNFSFWQDEPRWRVSGHDGYLALVHALRRAFDAGWPVGDPEHYATWSVDDLATVLRGDVGGAPVPPLLAERHAVAADVGRWLCDVHRGSALAALGAAASAAEFAQILAATLPRFRDVADWRGMRVAFLKRAQIAAHDCGAALGESAPAGLRDRSDLTAFADYKVPQMLRAEGVLVYAPALAETVDSRTEIAAGSSQEVEIRALTVVAVDQLASGLRARGTGCDAPLVDGWLWWRGQEGRDMAPYHRTRTIWY